MFPSLFFHGVYVTQGRVFKSRLFAALALKPQVLATASHRHAPHCPKGLEFAVPHPQGPRQRWQALGLRELDRKGLMWQQLIFERMSLGGKCQELRAKHVVAANSWERMWSWPRGPLVLTVTPWSSLPCLAGLSWWGARASLSLGNRCSPATAPGRGWQVRRAVAWC